MPNAQNKEMLASIKEDLDGVSAMVRQVEGVLLGFTLREREGGVWKVSMRATNPADASVVCAKFGGPCSG